MKKILVTGATGLMGKGLEETAPRQWRIVGLHQRDYKVEGARSEHLVLDIRERDAVNKLFARHRFDAVIHAAGVASVDYAQKHYAESLESNLVGTLNMTAACRKQGVHMVFVSTNAVFDGTKAPYREDDPVNPINKYGFIKAQCERLVQETLERCTIARPILMYGWNHAICRQNPATWIIEKLLRGERVNLVNDVFENPLYYRSAAQALWRIAAKKPRGIIHLAGADTMSRWEFGMKLAQVFGLDASLISPVGSGFFPDIAPRPRNTALLTARMARELGVKPLKVAQGLRLMKEHAE